MKRVLLQRAADAIQEPSWNSRIISHQIDKIRSSILQFFVIIITNFNNSNIDSYCMVIVLCIVTQNNNIMPSILNIMLFKKSIRFNTHQAGLRNYCDKQNLHDLSLQQIPKNFQKKTETPIENLYTLSLNVEQVITQQINLTSK